MRPEAEPVSKAIVSRRSIRQFTSQPIDTAIIRDLVALACVAPAPHHSRPWRFVQVASPQAKERLAEAMTAAWRADLEQEGEAPDAIERRLDRSRRQLTEAPVLLLACLSLDEARPWPDEARRRAERDMFMQSLGAALQNILVAAHAWGLGGYLKGAPLFCTQAVSQALGLPQGWEPALFVLLGYPAEGFEAAPRPPLAVDDFLVSR